VRWKLIKIKRSFGLGSVGIFLGLLEQFVKFSFQHFVVTLVIFERLSECLGATRFLSFQLLDRNADVLDHGRFFMLLVTDDGLKIRVDLEDRFATRAAYLKEFTFSFRHKANSSATSSGRTVDERGDVPIASESRAAKGRVRCVVLKVS
jgi:hypothetical protein